MPTISGQLEDEEETDIKPVYLRTNGEWVKQNAYERQNGEWVQVSYAQSGETSNFTLSDGSILLTSDGQIFNVTEE